MLNAIITFVINILDMFVPDYDLSFITPVARTWIGHIKFLLTPQTFGFLEFYLTCYAIHKIILAVMSIVGKVVFRIFKR